MRQSNIELLRIIAMFLVLLTHATSMSLGHPTTDEIAIDPLSSFGRFFLGSLSVSCVDIFVMISGWFTIRPSKRGLLNFLFQIAFFQIVIFLILLMAGEISTSSVSHLSYFLLLNSNWFIKAYMLLYIIAPVLNAFTESSNQKTQRWLLIGFFAFQTLYGWYSPACPFQEGYSTMSFIGLYLLARYAHLHTNRWFTLAKLYDALIILVGILLVTAISYYSTSVGGTWAAMMINYINPIVIVVSLYYVLLFSKLHIQNRFIKWVAASSFAVYLTHANSLVLVPYFKPWCITMYDSFCGMQLVAICFVTLFTIFILSVLVDQPCKWLWTIISKRIC